MSNTLESLRRKIDSADELWSVVRTMKAMAASNIGQYENAVRSLSDYYRSVTLGLIAYFRNEKMKTAAEVAPAEKNIPVCAVVFGSDQGLVGQFNEVLANYVVQELEKISGKKEVWAVGERIEAHLQDAGLVPSKLFSVPNSVTAITPLVGELLIDTETFRAKGKIVRVYLFHNAPQNGAAYEPVMQRILPPDEKWRKDIEAEHWPTKNPPEVIGNAENTLKALIREYLFVSLYRSCAESLASENASRLAAMQRAEKNIDDLLDRLNGDFHRLRQNTIDEELFDVISGFEALKGKRG